MRGHCELCRHSMRGVIDEHLRAGRDVRSLADEYGLETRAIRAHRDDHVLRAPSHARRGNAIFTAGSKDVPTVRPRA
jgi:hypothetical protein